MDLPSLADRVADLTVVRATVVAVLAFGAIPAYCLQPTGALFCIFYVPFFQNYAKNAK